MNTPQEDQDDTSLPGRFNNGDRFEIAGDTMTRTDGRWSCSCGQTHDDEQVQVDLADGSGVLVEAPNVPSVEGAREALIREALAVGQANANLTGEDPLGELLDVVEELVAAEVAAAVSEAQAEVERTTTAGMAAIEHANLRRMTAEAEVERLREGIRALADDRDSHSSGCPTWSITTGDCCCLVADLRALLSPSPAATTGEADEILSGYGTGLLS